MTLPKISSVAYYATYEVKRLVNLQTNNYEKAKELYILESLGLLNLASFVVTIVFFEQYVISVWCFFAALMSLEVFFAIKDLEAKPAFTDHSILPVHQIK